MDKKPYETPQLQTLGTVHELTQQIEKCTGSADLTLPREVPNGDALGADFACGPV
jgi:hypothetical protein